MMIRITRTFAIPENDISENFIKSSGPGGQNVNKVATAVQLRFDIDAASSLPEIVKQRLKKLARNQITSNNILIIEAKDHRTQAKNRRAAREKFSSIIRCALKPPKKRKRTRPTQASENRRLDNKRRRSRKKNLRQNPPQPD